MGLLSVLQGRPRNAVDERGLPVGMMAQTSSGVPIDERSALTVSDAYKCIRVLSEAVASLSLKIQEKVKVAADIGFNDATGHDLWPILHDQPNEFMTAFTFLEGAVAHLNTWGNQYAWIQRYSYSGRVAALWPLLPHTVTVNTKSGSPVYEVRSVRTGLKEDFQYDEILHIPGLGYDSIRGYSPIAMHRESLGLAKATEQFGAEYFGNGSRHGVIATHPGELGPDGAKRIKQLIDAQTSGKESWHRTLVLEEGITLHDVTIPNDEAQFLESRKYQRSDIAGIYRVPLHMIGDLAESTNNNIEFQGLSFYRDSLMPWLLRIEQEFYRKLLSPQEQRKFVIRFDFKSMLRGDTAAQTAHVKDGILTGIYTINEGRKYFGLNTFEGGDERFVMLNMIPWSKLDDYYSGKTAQTATPAPAKEPSNRAAELVSVAVRAAYGPVFTASVEKVVLRKQKDHEKFAPTVFRPFLDGLCAGLLGEDACAGMEDFLDEYSEGIGRRCSSWDGVPPASTAGVELDRAVKAILEKGIPEEKAVPA